MEPIHTHVYSEYSLLSSTNRMDALVDRAKEFGFHAIALTDKNVMYGVVPFYQACQKYGLKPIFGMEVTISLEEERKAATFATLRLLAKNNRGYENLLQIATNMGLADQKVTSINMENLLPLLADCLVILPYQTGPLRGFIEGNQLDAAMSWCHQWINADQKKDWLIELQGDCEIEGRQHECLIQLAETLQLDMIVSHPVCFLDKADVQSYYVVQAIGRGETLRSLDISPSESGHYMLSATQLTERYKKYDRALKVTAGLAERCQVELQIGQPQLPKYPLKQDENAEAVLRELCLQGIDSRYQEANDELYARLEYELRVIKQMGFSDYFLIVWDFMNYAREHRIMIGPGRGSAAGSLVAYVLNITDVDPIHYHLLFERFLNPERVSLPDIDIDFPDHRREEVIAYVQQRYGREHVAQILTFGTLAARAAIRDVGKVLEIDAYVIEQIAKEIPPTPGMTLDKAFQNSGKLPDILEQSEAAKLLFEQARKVEGLPRHTSTHAAGVIISSDPLTKRVALQGGQHTIPITQATMDSLEELGLLKFDFLGLRNLTLLERIVTFIKKDYGKKIDVKQLPLDDQKTYQLLSEGNTTGVFQLESQGMRKVLKELQPTEFEDIVAVNALYRPGPIEFIPTYVQGKNENKPIEYPHQDLEDILKSTYGVIVYQEQIMQIATKFAGFTLAEADVLRRSISKKKKQSIETQQHQFVEGAKAKGYEEKVAVSIFSFIERFANYGFNRSHAVAYSLISYQLAYLKVHFPDVFYAALLSSVWNNKEKISQYIFELKQAKMDILLPSIHDSDALFTIEEGKVRFGLLSIEQVGRKAVEHLQQEQSQKPFKDLYDFCVRIDVRLVSRRAIENLIKAGAMDRFGHDRAVLLKSVDQALAFAEKVTSFQEETAGLFTLDIETPDYEEAVPLTVQEKLEYEQEVLGFYLSGHPIEKVASVLQLYQRQTIVEAFERRGAVRIAGLVVSLRKIQTKKGKSMAFAEIGDETGKCEVVLFPETWNQVNALFQKGELLLIQGKVDTTRERVQLIAEKALPVADLIDKSERARQTLFLRVIVENDRLDVLSQIKQILSEFQGDTPVVLYYKEQKQTVRLDASLSVRPTSTCIDLLKQLLGENHVVLK